MKSMKKWGLCLIIVAAISCFCGFSAKAADSGCDTVKVKGTCNYTYAYQVLDLVNQERAAEGLSSLKMDKNLLNAAMQRAAELSIYYSHTRPSGKSYSTAASGIGAENIAGGQSSAAWVMGSWMNSSGHRRNILSASKKSIGIGCFTQGNTIFWVQNFSSTAATTVSKPKNATKTFSVSINPDQFDVNLSLKSDYGDYRTELPMKQSFPLTVSIRNPEFPIDTVLQSSSFSWSSSKKSIATVSSSGKAKGIKTGSTTIKAKSSSGKLSVSQKFKVVKNLLTQVTSLKNTSKGVKIKWKKSISASGYYVYRSQGLSDNYKKIKTIKKKSTTSYTDTSIKNNDGTIYSYIIVPYSGSKKGNGSDIKTIFRLTGTKLTSVKNSSSKKLTVKWKKGSKIKKDYVTKSGYQIQYSTSKSFKSGSKTKSVKVSSMSKTKKTLSKLKKGKTYYVRVRRYAKAFGNNYYSNWSSAKKVKVKK